MSSKALHGVCRKVFGVTCEEGRERKAGPACVGERDPLRCCLIQVGLTFFKIFTMMQYCLKSKNRYGKPFKFSV